MFRGALNTSNNNPVTLLNITKTNKQKPDSFNTYHNLCKVSVCPWSSGKRMAAVSSLSPYGIPWVTRPSPDSPRGTVFLMILRVPEGETGWSLYASSRVPGVLAFIQCQSVERWSLAGSVWILDAEHCEWLLLLPSSSLLKDWISFYKNGLL